MLRQTGQTILSPINQTVAAVRKRTFKEKCLIDFTRNKHKAFLEWCKVFGGCITFTQLEYRRDTGWIEHEFIRLGGLCLKDGFPQLPENSTGGIWDFFKLGDMENLICRLERTADPKHYFNAPTGTDAWDWVTIYAEGSENDEKDLSKSRQLLKIVFSEKRTLDEVLNICYRVAIHPKSRDYTLPKFNCYFFSWNIILGLARSSACYEKQVKSKRSEIIKEVLEQVRSLVSCTDKRFSLPLILTGHWDHVSLAGSETPSPFMRILEGHIKGERFIQALCERSYSNLWVSQHPNAVTRAVRDLLDAVADESAQLVLAGTGSNTLDSLFKVPKDVKSWNLSDMEMAQVDAQVSSLIMFCLSEGMWKLFGNALQQTDEATRLTNAANLTRQKLTLSQKAQFSDPYLLARMVPLGLETAAKNAEVALSLDPEVSKNPLARAGSSTKHNLEQKKRIMQIAMPFVSLVGARLEENAAREKPLNFDGPAKDLRSLVTDIALQPDMNKQVINELEKCIEKMAEIFPGDNATLRRATLKFVVDARNKGTDMSFFAEPVMIWQLALWYFLSEGIIASVLKALGPINDHVEHYCEWVEPKTRTAPSEQVQNKRTNAQIQTWVQQRVKALSERAFKDAVGTAESNRQQLEKAASEIWEGQHSWRDNKCQQPTGGSETSV